MQKSRVCKRRVYFVVYREAAGAISFQSRKGPESARGKSKKGDTCIPRIHTKTCNANCCTLEFCWVL